MRRKKKIAEYDEQMLIENMNGIDDMLALISFAQSPPRSKCGYKVSGDKKSRVKITTKPFK